MTIALALMLSGCAAKAEGPIPTPPAPAAHGSEPLWASWSAEAFEQAEAENRIILINVVASWCHWCHVMDEETYADPKVVSLLREHFVTLRVDSVGDAVTTARRLFETHRDDSGMFRHGADDDEQSLRYLRDEGVAYKRRARPPTWSTYGDASSPVPPANSIQALSSRC